MGELANCPNCGALFVKGIRTVCNECYKEEEKQFEIVHTYVRKKENRMATIVEVSKATGVDEELIIKFVKEKRLSTVQFQNLGYSCERCGTIIKEGKICSNCRKELVHDLSLEEKRQAPETDTKKESNRTYYSVDRKFGGK